MRRVFGLLVGLALVSALSGCSSGGAGGPTPSGTPSPPVSVSPSPSPTPDMDALYAEAERVWLRSVELRSSYELRGESDEFPPELETLLADPHLSLMRSAYEASKQEGWRAPEGAVPIIRTHPLPGISRDGSMVALQTCVDTRPVPLSDNSGRVVSDGRLILAHLFFKDVGGGPRLFIADAQGEIQECPF
ncbi:MAG: hypothetical protein QM286_12220 [Acidobacteriota bacterium]|nr:hypothetical protein [Acidobacteriota bacterium]